MAHVLGRATIKYNGKTLLTEKGAKLNVGGIARKDVVGDEVHGYSEEMTAPFIDCTINVTKDTDLKALQDITDATVTFEGDIGSVWVLKNAWSSTPPEITAAEGGKCPVKFTGMSCHKL